MLHEIGRNFLHHLRLVRTTASTCPRRRSPGGMDANQGWRRVVHDMHRMSEGRYREGSRKAFGTAFGRPCPEPRHLDFRQAIKETCLACALEAHMEENEWTPRPVPPSFHSCGIGGEYVYE